MGTLWNMPRVLIVVLIFVSSASQGLPAAQISGGFVSPIFQRSLGMQTFDVDLEGWVPETRARLRLVNQTLHVEAAGRDPAFYHLFDTPCTQLRLRMKVKTRDEAVCEIFWLTQEIPQRDPLHRVKLSFQTDDLWHEYEMILPVTGHLTCLSFKMTAPTGSWSFDDIELTAQVPFPLLVKDAVREGDVMKYTIVNSSLKPVSFTEGSTTGEKNLPSKGSLELTLPIRNYGTLELADLKLIVPDFPEVNHPMYFYNPEGKTDWLKRPIASGLPNDPGWVLEISPDARIARIMQPPKAGETELRLLALLAPLVHRSGVLPEFQLDPASTDRELHFTAPDAKLTLAIRGNEIDFHVEPIPSQAAKTAPLEGPVLRVPGRLAGGVLCGVEYLGPGDVSSSNIDVQEPNNNRSVPPPDWITFPLAAIATESLSVGLTWNNMRLQPTYSSPNRFDLADDHRMSLIGGKLDATIRLVEPVSGQDPITEMIRWAVVKHGIADPPTAPRTAEEQQRLCLAAFDGPLLGNDKVSWGYYAENDQPKEPYADVLSTLYRLKGELPRVAGLEPEGSVLTNDAIYFLTDQVQQWKDLRGEDVRKAIEEMKPDGSFTRHSLFPEQDYYQEFAGNSAANSDNRNKNSFGYAARKAAFCSITPERPATGKCWRRRKKRSAF